MSELARARLTAAKIVLLVFAVASARLALIQSYGSSVPFWDQWPGEGQMLFKPFLEGRLTFADLFAAHNEHRIFFSRVLALALFWLNHQWDPLVECCANAVLAAMIPGLLVALAAREIGRRIVDVALLAALAIFALPLSWENVLWGFQSSLFFQCLLSLGAIWGIAFRRTGSLSWWLGQLAALASIFTQASGFLVYVPLLLLFGARLAKRRRSSRADIVFAIYAVAMLAVGAGLLVTAHAPPVDRVVDFAGFRLALLRHLAWPNTEHPWAAIAYAPLAFVSIRRLVRRSGYPDERADELLFACGSWIVLLMMTIAFGRGGRGMGPAARHLDIQCVGLLLNTIAAAVWLRRERRWIVRFAVALLWLAGAACVFSFALDAFRVGLPQKRRESEMQLRNLNGYSRTHDLQFFRSKFPGDEPYVFIDTLAACLDDPVLKPCLPGDLQPPLALTQLPEGQFSFKQITDQPNSPNETKSWSSAVDHPLPQWARFQSAPLSTDARFVKFDITGSFGGWGSSLKLKPAAGSRPVSARAVPRDVVEPRSVAMLVPRSPFTVEASDRRPGLSFAFGEPHPIGPLSFAAIRLLDCAEPFTWVTVELLLALIIAGMAGDRLAARKEIADASNGG